VLLASSTVSSGAARFSSDRFARIPPAGAKPLMSRAPLSSSIVLTWQKGIRLDRELFGHCLHLLDRLKHVAEGRPQTIGTQVDSALRLDAEIGAAVDHHGKVIITTAESIASAASFGPTQKQQFRAACGSVTLLDFVSRRAMHTRGGAELASVRKALTVLDSGVLALAEALWVHSIPAGPTAVGGQSHIIDCVRSRLRRPPELVDATDLSFGVSAASLGRICGRGVGGGPAGPPHPNGAATPGVAAPGSTVPVAKATPATASSVAKLLVLLAGRELADRRPLRLQDAAVYDAHCAMRQIERLCLTVVRWRTEPSNAEHAALREAAILGLGVLLMQDQTACVDVKLVPDRAVARTALGIDPELPTLPPPHRKASSNSVVFFDMMSHTVRILHGLTKVRAPVIATVMMAASLLPTDADPHLAAIQLARRWNTWHRTALDSVLREHPTASTPGLTVLHAWARDVRTLLAAPLDASFDPPCYGDAAALIAVTLDRAPRLAGTPLCALLDELKPQMADVIRRLTKPVTDWTTLLDYLAVAVTTADKFAFAPWAEQRRCDPHGAIVVAMDLLARPLMEKLIANEFGALPAGQALEDLRSAVVTWMTRHSRKCAHLGLCAPVVVSLFSRIVSAHMAPVPSDNSSSPALADALQELVGVDGGDLAVLLVYCVQHVAPSDETRLSATLGFVVQLVHSVLHRPGSRSAHLGHALGFCRYVPLRTLAYTIQEVVAQQVDGPPIRLLLQRLSAGEAPSSPMYGAVAASLSQMTSDGGHVTFEESLEVLAALEGAGKARPYAISKPLSALIGASAPSWGQVDVSELTRLLRMSAATDLGRGNETALLPVAAAAGAVACGAAEDTVVSVCEASFAALGPEGLAAAVRAMIALGTEGLVRSCAGLRLRLKCVHASPQSDDQVSVFDETIHASMRTFQQCSATGASEWFDVATAAVEVIVSLHAMQRAASSAAVPASVMLADAFVARSHNLKGLIEADTTGTVRPRFFASMLALAATANTADVLQQRAVLRLFEFFGSECLARADRNGHVALLHPANATLTDGGGCYHATLQAVRSDSSAAAGSLLLRAVPMLLMDQGNVDSHAASFNTLAGPYLIAMCASVGISRVEGCIAAVAARGSAPGGELRAALDQLMPVLTMARRVAEKPHDPALRPMFRPHTACTNLLAHLVKLAEAESGALA
jgi:hypothetical protein